MGESIEIIGNYQFPFCSLLQNIAIPNLVTPIGNYAFYSCYGLEAVSIGENVETIGESAFRSCSSLKCIYFYGETSPIVGSSAFSGVPAAYVMTLETFQNETFGDLNVSKGITIDGCIPMSIPRFAESNIFTKSNRFTELIRSGATFDSTFILTYSFIFTQTISICDSTLSISVTSSGSTHVHAESIYYEYTVVGYSFYRSYYFSIFTIHYPSEAQAIGSKATVIIAACAAAGAVLVVVLFVITLVNIRGRRQTDIEQEPGDHVQKDFEITNTFSMGFSTSNIKEDPFVKDFKEDKFIDQI